MGYRLEVITDNVPEAVRHAGGLMCDRSRAGWQVVVVTNDVSHARALTILGVRAQPPGQVEDRRYGPESRTTISSADDFAADEEPPGGSDIHPPNQLLLWSLGDNDESSDLYPLKYRLSPAARTFKTHALRSTGLNTGAENCEYFWAVNTIEYGSSTDLSPVDDPAHLPGSADRGGARPPTVVGEFARG